jgi:hypothetical protein
MVKRSSALQLMASVGLLACVTACEDGSSDKQPEAIAEGSPLYAVMYEVYGENDESDSYLSVFDSLDIDELDTKSAREFPAGRAFLQAYNDWVFVGEPAAPNIIRFSVGEDGQLEEDKTLSLADYGEMNASIDDWAVNFISPTKAYYFLGESGVTLVWNPSTMELIGEIPAPEDFRREGLNTSAAPAAARGDRLFRAIYWQTDDNENSKDTRLLVYDTKNDELVESSEDARCPAPGNRAWVAEDGTIYFSNWVWAVSDTLLNGADDTCVLRVQPDAETFDADWSLKFAEIADGRQGAMFTYVGEGKGIVSIFHDEEVERDETTTPWDFASAEQWEVWTVDLEKRSGEPVEGVPLNTGAYTPVTLDNRLFIMVPTAEWVGTQMYEVEGNKAEPFVKIPGWSYMFEQIR